MDSVMIEPEGMRQTGITSWLDPEPPLVPAGHEPLLADDVKNPGKVYEDCDAHMANPKPKPPVLQIAHLTEGNCPAPSGGQGVSLEKATSGRLSGQYDASLRGTVITGSSSSGDPRQQWSRP